ncbi:MAG: sulfatase-like hydrolase/transferase [Pseudohongiellaceae bacterium]
MNPMQKIQIVLFFMAVAISHYYNLDLTLTTLLAALASVSLLIFSTTALISRIEKQALRTAVGFVLIYLLSFYYASQFLSYYLQGSYFNQQYFFHFNLATLIETRFVYYPLMILVLAWTACVLAGFYYFRNRPPRSNHSKTILCTMLLLALILDPGLRPSTIELVSAAVSPRYSSLDEIDWEELELQQEALTTLPPTASPGKNLLFIFLEGLEAIYTDEEVFPGLTPTLRRLNAEGWQLENMQQIHGSGWTMGGIVSSMCGTPLVYESRLTGNEVLFSRLLDSATCLPDILQSAGYQQVFMGGASLDFANKGDFLLDHGFDAALGSDELADELEDPEYLGGWGLYDESLFALAADKFRSLASLDQPFNLTLLTVDTHHPSGEPSPSCPSYNAIDNSILHAVHCTDFLLGKFIEQIKKSPTYEDTVIVLLSDHLSMRNIAFPLFPADYERKLYFNVLNAEQQGMEQMVATPLDVSPTLLELMDVEHDATFLAGVNLLDMSAKAAEREALNSAQLNAIRYINSNHLSVKAGETVYALNRVSAEEIDFSASIENIEYVSGSLKFESSSEDPYFFLPALPDVKFDDSMLYITLDNDADLSVAVYYEEEVGEKYSEENTLVRFITPGVNQIAFDLEGFADGSRIRVDPGNLAGSYSIRDIEIRSQ